MIAAMLAAVLASAVATGTVPGARLGASAGTTRGVAAGRTATPPDDDPAVRVTLNSQNLYDPGDRARVRVHVRDDSYLIVLHADASGVVHVLYPINPGDDNFAPAGEDFEVRGNTQDASFVVDNVRGTGMVYAAVSKDPFHFDEFSNGSQWAGNAFPDTARGDNAEAVLTDVVQRAATAGGRFDYDLVTYTVTAHRPPRNTYATAPTYGAPPPSDYYPGEPDYGPSYGPYYDPWYGPAFGVGIGPWWGYGYNPWWGYSPWYGAGFGLGLGYGFGGCWGCSGGGYWGGGYYGYYPGYGYGPHGPFAGRPGFTPPIGYRPRGTVLANHSTINPGHLGGTPYAVHGGFAGRPAVFANARLASVPGGLAAVGYRGRGATVFPQVHAATAVARPGMGHIVTSGGEAVRAQRVNPVGPGAIAGRVNPNGRVMGGPMGARVGGQAMGMRAPARAYRVQSGGPSGGSRGWGGGNVSPRSYGGGRSFGGRSGGGGGGQHYSGGGGGGGHAGGHGGGGGGGGGHGGGGHGGHR